MAANDPKEREYEGYRQAAREMTESDIFDRAEGGDFTSNALLGMRLTSIDDTTLDAISEQWGTSEFPWRQICGQARPFIRRFEVAIWIGDELEGLCTGRASRGDDNVTIHFLERSPDPSYLKGYIAEIATDAAEAYAFVIGRRRVKLKNPVPGALPVYQTLGFTLAETYRRNTYYERLVP